VTPGRVVTPPCGGVDGDGDGVTSLLSLKLLRLLMSFMASSLAAIPDS
jgi:hypothetical protein